MKYLLWRDIIASTRMGGGGGQSLGFYLIVIVLVPLSLGPSTERLAVIAPGMLWISALLACLLSLDRIFALDFEDGSLDLLATSPLPLEGIAMTKTVGHWLVTFGPVLLLTPILAVLLNLPAQGYVSLMLSLLLGTPALSAIGTFGAALTVGIKRGGALLSLIVLPLYIPTLVFGAEVARRGAVGMSYDQALALLAGVTCASIALLPFVVAFVIRINLR